MLLLGAIFKILSLLGCQYGVRENDDSLKVICDSGEIATEDIPCIYRVLQMVLERHWDALDTAKLAADFAACHINSLGFQIV